MLRATSQMIRKSLKILNLRIPTVIRQSIRGCVTATQDILSHISVYLYIDEHCIHQNE